MKNICYLFGALLLVACNYKPKLKLTVSNSSQRTISDIKIGHNNPAEAVVIPTLKAGEEIDVELHFKQTKKENGRYWITTADGFSDSFGFYKNGLPVHTWVGIEHQGDQVKVSLQ